MQQRRITTGEWSAGWRRTCGGPRSVDTHFVRRMANGEWGTGRTTWCRVWPAMRHPVGFAARAGTRPAPTPCLQQCVTKRPRMFPARCRGGPCCRPRSPQRGVRSLDTHLVVAARATPGEWRIADGGVPPARCVGREARWCGGVLAAVLVATLGCRFEAWAMQHGEARVAGVSGFGFRSAAQIKRGAASVSHDPAVAARSAEARSVGHAHACAASVQSLPCNSSTVISRGVNSRMRCPVTPRPQLTYRVEPPSRNSPRS